VKPLQSVTLYRSGTGGHSCGSPGCGNEVASDVVSGTVWVVGLPPRPVSRTPLSLATKAPALARNICALHHPGVHCSDALICTRLSGFVAEANQPSSSSHGVLQRSPFRRHRARESTSGFPERLAATPRARSALAVPPGFSGLLLTSPRRLVASCSRP
jgi:hypothetical protein